jgi:hypothetical protein
MHTFVFWSYELILASPEAHLVRDVRCDVDKARSKLKSIQQQLLRDRERADAREDLLTRVEAKLSAAIVAVQSNRSMEGRAMTTLTHGNPPIDAGGHFTACDVKGGAPRLGGNALNCRCPNEGHEKLGCEPTIIRDRPERKSPQSKCYRADAAHDRKGSDDHRRRV